MSMSKKVKFAFISAEVVWRNRLAGPERVLINAGADTAACGVPTCPSAAPLVWLPAEPRICGGGDGSGLTKTVGFQGEASARYSQTRSGAGPIYRTAQ